MSPFLFLFTQLHHAFAEPERLVILSPHWEGIRQEFAWGFQDWHAKKYGRPVEVVWLDQGGTSECLRFIFAQYLRAPEGIGIDLFFGGGTDPYVELKKRGLLQPCPPPEGFAQRVPAELGGVPLYDPDFHWFGTHLSTFGILVNKWVLDRRGLPEPRRWEDLADPKFFDWVGAGDPRGSGTMHMMYELVLQSYGWEKGLGVLARFSGNVRRFNRHGGQTAKDVAMGEVACGMALDSYAWAEIDAAGRDKLAFVVPSGETVVNPDSIAVLKGAPSPRLAREFVAYALSPEGQRLSIFPAGSPGGPREHNLYKMCVDPTAYAEPQSRVFFDPFAAAAATAEGFRYDFEKGAARWDLVNRLLASLYLDPHARLKRAWKAVIRGGLKREKLARLESAPVGEKEALALARGVWKNPLEREKISQSWGRFAREKYLQLLRRDDDPRGRRS